MLFVIASMEVEIEGLFGLDRTLDHWRKCKLSYTGIGRKNVEKTFERMDVESGVNGLLSVGFAGSVDPKVSSGQLCLVDSVRAGAEEDVRYSNREFRDRAASVLGEDCLRCDLLTVEETARTAADKKSVREAGFSIVDQESYWVAEVAHKKDIPFLGLRVVFDGPDQKLPPETCYDEDTGKVISGRMVSWLAKKPVRIRSLPKLVWNSVRARRKLTDAINRVAPALLGE